MSITSYVSVLNQADTATLSLGSWSASLPLASLQTSVMGEVARSAAKTHGSTCFKITANPAASVARCVHLIRHNLTGPYPGVSPVETTRYRVRGVYGSPGSPATFFPRALPVAILASSNLTGAVSALQDPDPENKTGAWLTATSSTTNTDVRVSLQASSPGLLVGAGAQPILVYLRRTGGGGSNPTATVDLYHSGSLVTNLATGVSISSTSGTLLSYTWNASLLGGSPPSASGLEVRVRGTASATATVEVGSIQWLAEFAPTGSVALMDSGWLTPPNLPTNYWGPPRSLSQLYLPYTADSDFTWDELWWECQAVANYDSYFQAGRLWVGPALTFQDAFGLATYEDLGIVHRFVDPSIKERMRSGDLDRDRRRGWKELSFRFSQLSKSCTYDTVYEAVQRYAGMTRDCVWVPRPSETDRANSTVCFGTLKSIDDVAQASPTGYETSVTVEETVG